MDNKMTKKRFIISLLVFEIILASFYSSAVVASDDSVTVYSARKEHLIQPLFEAFTDKTGIEVKYFTGDSGALIERIKLEGKNTDADMFMTVDAGNLWYASTKDLFQSVNTDTLVNNIPSHLRDPDGLWTGLSVRARTIIYSTERVNPADLSTYEDLADSKWRGKLCLRTSKKIYTKSLVASLIHHNGEEKTNTMVNGWVENLATIPNSKDNDIMSAILAGQCDVGIVNAYYFGRLQAQEPNTPLKLFWANQETTGTHVNISGAGVTKYASNPQGAIQLLEFLSSDKAQHIYIDLNKEYPASKNLKADNLISHWGDFKQDTINLSIAGKNQVVAVMLMQRAGYK